MSSYEADPIFQKLGQELLDARHLVKHGAQDANRLGEMLAAHCRELLTVLRKLKADQPTIDRLHGLAVAAVAKAAWIETAMKIGCDCVTRVDRAGVDEPRPTEAQIEAAYLDRKVVPIRKFVMLVKPPRGA